MMMDRQRPSGEQACKRPRCLGEEAERQRKRRPLPRDAVGYAAPEPGSAVAVACPVCSAPLASLDAAAREAHVNACLDGTATATAAPTSTCDSGSNRESGPPAAPGDPAAAAAAACTCAICGADLTPLTLEARSEHANRCCDSLLEIPVNSLSPHATPRAAPSPFSTSQKQQRQQQPIRQSMATEGSLLDRGSALGGDGPAGCSLMWPGSGAGNQSRKPQGEGQGGRGRRTGGGGGGDGGGDMRGASYRCAACGKDLSASNFMARVGHVKKCGGGGGGGGDSAAQGQAVVAPISRPAAPGTSVALQPRRAAAAAAAAAPEAAGGSSSLLEPLRPLWKRGSRSIVGAPEGAGGGRDESGRRAGGEGGPPGGRAAAAAASGGAAAGGGGGAGGCHGALEASWSPEAWLSGLGLSKYSSALREALRLVGEERRQELGPTSPTFSSSLPPTVSSVASLTDAGLIAAGVAALGARRKILAAASSLVQPPTRKALPSPAAQPLRPAPPPHPAGARCSSPSSDSRGSDKLTPPFSRGSQVPLLLRVQRVQPGAGGSLWSVAGSTSQGWQRHEEKETGPPDVGAGPRGQGVSPGAAADKERNTDVCAGGDGLAASASAAAATGREGLLVGQTRSCYGRASDVLAGHARQQEEDGRASHGEEEEEEGEEESSEDDDEVIVVCSQRHVGSEVDGGNVMSEDTSAAACRALGGAAVEQAPAAAARVRELKAELRKAEQEVQRLKAALQEAEHEVAKGVQEDVWPN